SSPTWRLPTAATSQTATRKSSSPPRVRSMRCGESSGRRRASGGSGRGGGGGGTGLCLPLSRLFYPPIEPLIAVDVHAPDAGDEPRLEAERRRALQKARLAPALDEGHAAGAVRQEIGSAGPILHCELGADQEDEARLAEPDRGKGGVRAIE